MMRIARQHNKGNGLCTVPGWVRGKWEPCFILIFAFFYYASYYRSGFNLGGEGGTVGILALRLLEGQRPILDTFLGYNVLWFYPIAGLFKIFGPSYLILKIYFFALCALTALLATLLVRRVTRSSLLAVSVGLVLVLIPGTQFRNYLPLLAILNMVALFQAFVFPHKTFWRREFRFVLAGVVLGLTYLIRIDVGILVTLVILTLLLVFPWSVENGPLFGIFTTVVGGLTIAIFALLMQVPFFWDAHRRDFQDPFLGQYKSWYEYIKFEASSTYSQSFNKALPPPSQFSTSLPPQEKTNASTARLEEQLGLSRPPLSDIAQHKTVRLLFAWSIYAPIPIICLILIGMGLVWLINVLKRNFEECNSALGVLTALGCSLILFPQYFFFRPDTPHLSEFMVPFLVTMVLACFQAVRLAQAKKYAWIYAALLLLLCITDTMGHLSNGFRRESSGSIAAIKQRGKEFIADNGVRVFVNPEYFKELQGIYTTIIKNSQPTDWVVCYPYLPTINFMTNRRSYEYNLYVDNATKGKVFDAVSIHKILYFQPAVIVIGDSPINHNRASYFKNWAAPTYQFIKDHYQYAGTYGDTEIYVRKKKE